MKKAICKHLRLLARAFTFIVACALALAPAMTAYAAPLSLPDVPLDLTNSVQPNVIFTIDDSGSMGWGFLPDPVGGITAGSTDLATYPRGCSSTVNRIYYDPTVAYQPAVNSSDGPLNTTATSFTAAYLDGYNTGAGTVDLSSNYQVTWNALFGEPYASCGTGTTSGQAAFYYVYDPTTTACSPVATSNDACYRKVVVSSTSGPGGTDERQNFANWYSYYRTHTLDAMTSAGLSFAKVQDGAIRIAYQRINTCNTGFGQAPSASCPGTYVQPFSTGYTNPATSQNARNTFFTWLYNSPAGGGTPMLDAMQRAGNYISQTSSTNGVYEPWAQNPGTSVGTEYSCRQNFSVIFTDGEWNVSPSIHTVSTDTDSTAVTLPDGTAYTPDGSNQLIYPDNSSPASTAPNLADISFYYWSHDLRPDLTNNVPPYIPYSTSGNTPTTLSTADYYNPENDPATWQHVSTFTVGLGANGDLTWDQPSNGPCYQALLTSGSTAETACTGSSQTGWPITSTSGPLANLDDLWHAAINGRGMYYSAANPSQLVSAFSSILNNIGARQGTASGLGASSGYLGGSGSTYIYQSKFNTTGWVGQVLAYLLNSSTGAIPSSATWDAGQVLNSSQNYDTGRAIITLNPTTNAGVPFRWANLSASQTADLDLVPYAGGTSDTLGADRLNYLRGSSANEGTGDNFRVRLCYSGATPTACVPNNGHLGDIVDSTPLYVGAPAFNYPDTLEAAPYSTFVSTYQNRTPMIYVGANDGMLHGFNANTGQEEIAYVPNAVFPNLSQLTAPNYSHEFFVDGSPSEGDVFITKAGTPQWRSVLVGGLREGGMAYYALDVTDPSQFNEGNASNIVLWEFTDPDLGDTYSKPTIAKMANGEWAAVFGNGYNSTGTTGDAFLYIVFIGGGSGTTWPPGSFVKIDTGAGTAQSSTATPNGLAEPAVVDVDADNIAEYVYAGDLQGNMWRFDLTSTNPSNWSSNSNHPVKIFVAKDSAGNLQPITSSPEVSDQPTGLGGYMVYFGTGKYLEPGDNTTVGATTQTFYGIWDNNWTAAPTRSSLLQQTFIASSNSSVRVTTDYPMVWRPSSGSTAGTYEGWYLDLPTTGERQITDSVLDNGNIVFNTLIPSSDPCQYGGTGWLMELDAMNGGRPTATFDLNGDGVVDASDNVTAGGQSVAAEGVPEGAGISTPTILTLPNGPKPAPGGPGGPSSCLQIKYQPSPSGTIQNIAESCGPNTGRISWTQIR